MKKYCLTLIARKQEMFEPSFYEAIESDNLIEAISKFILAIARLQQQEIKEIKRHIVDDDIPF